MTGLDKILDQIHAEGNAEAQSIIDDANASAEAIIAEAQAEAGKLTESIQKKSASDVASYKKRVESSNDLYRRNETLKCKQEVIAKVIEMAYDEVCSMDTESYFDMLEKLIKRYALAQDGEICFSAKDLKRMPEGFQKKIEAAAAGTGGSLTLSKDEKNIENGFILVYGGIEENCTFRAIFDSRQDEMQDRVHAILFEEEA